jgi:hypothetical protein
MSSRCGAAYPFNSRLQRELDTPHVVSIRPSCRQSD